MNADKSQHDERGVRRRTRRVIAGVTFIAALMVFAIVQDRVTAAAARRYVAGQRAALASGAPPLNVDDIMRPAIAESVREALAWSGGVVVIGLLAAMALERR